MVIVALVVILALSESLESGGCIHTNHCFCEPDESSLEFCGGEVSQSCTNIQTQAACFGQKRILRELTGGCRDTEDEVGCNSTVVTCWTEYQCKWIPGVPSGGVCVNFSIIDYAQSTTATVAACPP